MAPGPRKSRGSVLAHAREYLRDAYSESRVGGSSLPSGGEESMSEEEKSQAGPPVASAPTWGISHVDTSPPTARDQDQSDLGDREECIAAFLRNSMSLKHTPALLAPPRPQPEPDDEDEEPGIAKRCSILSNLIIQRETYLKHMLQSMTERLRHQHDACTDIARSNKSLAQQLSTQRDTNQAALSALNNKHGLELSLKSHEIARLRECLADHAALRSHAHASKAEDPPAPPALDFQQQQRACILEGVVVTMEGLKGRLVTCTPATLSELAKYAQEARVARDRRKVGAGRRSRPTPRSSPIAVQGGPHRRQGHLRGSLRGPHRRGGRALPQCGDAQAVAAARVRSEDARGV